MKQQKNQASPAGGPLPGQLPPQGAESDILRDLQGEVSEESQPLLEFITRHGSLIATTVVLFLVVIGLSGLWNWYTAKQHKEALAELARTEMRLQGAERVKALRELAQKVPSDATLAVWLAVGQASLEAKDFNGAAEAFATAAKSDAEGALGLAASLGQATSLLKADKAAEAVTLLQAIAAQNSELGQSPALRQLLAQAAAKAGNNDLAAKTYQALAKESQGLDSAYFAARAEALQAAKKDK